MQAALQCELMCRRKGEGVVAVQRFFCLSLSAYHFRHYPVQKQCSPGPGHYEHDRDISKNDKPKFSMGKRTTASKREHGPLQYVDTIPVHAVYVCAFNGHFQRNS